MVCECLMADGRKGSRHEQKAGNVGESFHVSCGWVNAGLGAAPAGRVWISRTACSQTPWRDREDLSCKPTARTLPVHQESSG